MDLFLLEWVLEWLRAHPWGWVLVLVVVVFVLFTWLGTPFHWRDTEGDTHRTG